MVVHSVSGSPAMGIASVALAVLGIFVTICTARRRRSRERLGCRTRITILFHGQEIKLKSDHRIAGIDHLTDARERDARRSGPRRFAHPLLIGVVVSAIVLVAVILFDRRAPLSEPPSPHRPLSRGSR